MNATIELIYKNKIIREKREKDTGEVYKELVVQGEQKINLPDGQFKLESYDVPVDISLDKNFSDKKYGDIVKVPCNIYAKAVNAEYATLGISKAK
jgi:hypothetical protein